MSRSPSRHPPVFLSASVLIAVLLSALLLDNHRYLFDTNLYEFDDLVLNSLQIDAAKSFHTLYGQYSRWGFHHPGPAFFYIQAWGELLFHDWLHLVPQPLNGQMLATGVLNVFFISVALATAASWVGLRTVFLPLALALGTLHIAAIQFPGCPLGALFLLGNWPGYYLVVPFAALLITLASVAAGRGESLPFAVLTGCFLVHAHIVQPVLFVLPLSALAYLGLVVACREKASGFGAASVGGGRWALAARPWRVFPRAHLFVTLIVAVFAAPILIDLCRGRESNFLRVLAFHRAYGGEPHKTLAASLLYFVQFGIYRWYDPNMGYVEAYTAQGVWQFLRAGRLVGEFWLVSGAGSAFVMWSWVRRKDIAAGIVSEGDTAPTTARRRYTLWLAGFTGAAVLMTLAWGCIMTGRMEYYNAYFNYAIFYVGMLVVAAVAADLVCSATPPGWNGRPARWFLYGVVILLAVLNAQEFRLNDYAQPPTLKLIGQSVADMLRNEPAEPRTRYLSFADQDWIVAANIALELERQGHSYLAAKRWDVDFGEDHCPANPLQAGQAASKKGQFRFWKILPTTEVPAGAVTRLVTANRVLLADAGSDVDPTSGFEIRFGEMDGNETGYTPLGWSGREAKSDFLWNDGRQALLTFRAKPVPAESTVRLVFHCFPHLEAGKVTAQRLEPSFNGLELGDWRRTSDEPFEVTVPASAWNAREDAWLLLNFPDSASPASLRVSSDTRVLAFGFRRIEFRVERHLEEGGGAKERVSAGK